MGICAFFDMSNWFGVVVFQRSMLNWKRGWGQYAMGICVFCYIWQLFGVLVFQRSMLDWRRWGGVSLPWDMCILLYMKLIWCSGASLIYAHLGGTSDWGICEFYDMYNCFGVVVLHRSMLNWRRRWGQSAMGNGFAEIYAQLEEGGSICQIWTHFDMGICAFCYIWNLFGVMVFQRSMLNWRRVVGSICHG